MIVRTKPTKNFTKIRNTLMDNPNLSLIAKGLWAFVMTKPDTWVITSRGLASQSKESRNTIMGALKELEDAGYFKLGQRHQKDGKWSTSESVMYDTPQPTVAQKTDHGKLSHIVKTNISNVKPSFSPLVPLKVGGGTTIIRVITEDH